MFGDAPLTLKLFVLFTECFKIEKKMTSKYILMEIDVTNHYGKFFFHSHESIEYFAFTKKNYLKIRKMSYLDHLCKKEKKLSKDFMYGILSTKTL